MGMAIKAMAAMACATTAMARDRLNLILVITTTEEGTEGMVK